MQGKTGELFSVHTLHKGYSLLECGAEEGIVNVHEAMNWEPDTKEQKMEERAALLLEFGPLN